MEGLDKKIFDYIKKTKIVTSSEISEQMRVSWNTAEKHLLELIIQGKIDRLKKAGVNLWIAK